MNRLLAGIILLFGLFFLLLTACVKKTDPAEEPCRILEFATYVKYPSDIKYDTITAKFNYDSQDRLTSIIFNKNETGRPNYHFKYDADGKLIMIAGLWPTSKAFDYVYKFNYRGNTIVSDSMFYSGSDTNNLMHLTQNLFIGNYTYDASSRLIEQDYNIFFPMVPTAAPVHHNIRYAYDANGNLIGNGGTTFSYDDKINFLTLHPALQVLNRNYSVNNAVPATSYNKHGLPLVFDHTQPHPFNKAPFMNIGVSKIVYSCD